MANPKLTVVVITPEREVLNAASESIVIPAHDGELGVLQDRAPLMCELGVGQLRYRADGREKRLMIDGGFAQVHDNKVTVLTNRAMPAEEITPVAIANEEANLQKLENTGPLDRDAVARARRRLSTLRALRS